ncbi:MAG: acyl carrier protein [Hydrogenophaga sp.]|jgi:acyl carrier protein|uniref:acyl carrier protein n=1 Tax=Hydrogenophaga sp. TaxID=1904254 RepID=UPI00261C258C|nr:acyl carrier protein [Hydrogenophaga sp.]MCW5670382.1 acyl carrier protein [Hydrogenophaga sp.]
MSEKAKTQVSMSEALAMLAECFNLPVEDMHADLQRDAIDDWDSMGALMLMAELDERFGIELTAEASREMTRIGDVLAFLKVHGALSENA